MSKSQDWQTTDWQENLSDQEYWICRKGGTEAPFTGQYWDCHQPGRYFCRCCGIELFDAEHKYDSGSGWPSFFQALAEERILSLQDNSHGMVRTEIRCARCDSHLGHLFPDGPAPTGLRYCVNSASLRHENDA